MPMESWLEEPDQLVQTLEISDILLTAVDERDIDSSGAEPENGDVWTIKLDETLYSVEYEGEGDLVEEMTDDLIKSPLKVRLHRDSDVVESLDEFEGSVRQRRSLDAAAQPDWNLAIPYIRQIQGLYQDLHGENVRVTNLKGSGETIDEAVEDFVPSLHMRVKPADQLRNSEDYQDSNIGLTFKWSGDDWELHILSYGESLYKRHDPRLVGDALDDYPEAFNYPEGRFEINEGIIDEELVGMPGGGG